MPPAVTHTARAVPLLILAYLGFVSLGLPDGLLGVGWPWMRGEFGAALGAVGYLLFAGTTGYLISSVAAGFLLARLGVGALLTGSTVLAALGMAGYALSGTLWLAAAAALVLGLGSGAIDSGLNAYAAGHFSARHMNWLHASFGLGAMAGPLVMTAALSTALGWRWGYGIVAVAQTLLAVAFALTARAWGARTRPGDTTTATPPARKTFALPAVWLSVAMFGVYTGLEIAAGLWAYTRLTTGHGMSPETAGLWVSAYWGSLLVGRILVGVVAHHVPTSRVLWGGMLGMALGAALLLPDQTALTVAGLMLLGFSAAPVFPMLTHTTADRVGAAHADRTVGLQIASAGLFGVALPAGIGVLIEREGTGVLGIGLVTLAATLLALHLLATRTPTRPAV